MNFKLALERRTFEIAKRVCGDAALIEHNKTLRIEVATSREVASFVGPPKKEIDVITAGFNKSPDIKVLISCKGYRNSRAELADIQEWTAVVRAMNKYSGGSKYLGLVVCPFGDEFREEFVGHCLILTLGRTINERQCLSDIAIMS